MYSYMHINKRACVHSNAIIIILREKCILMHMHVRTCTLHVREHVFMDLAESNFTLFYDFSLYKDRIRIYLKNINEML